MVNHALVDPAVGDRAESRCGTEDLRRICGRCDDSALAELVLWIGRRKGSHVGKVSGSNVLSYMEPHLETILNDAKRHPPDDTGSEVA